MESQRLAPLDEWFGVPGAPSFAVAPFGGAIFTVTKLKVDASSVSIVEIPPAAAYLLVLNLDSGIRAIESIDAEEYGREGTICLTSLRGGIVFQLRNGLDALGFYMPMQIFDELAEAMNTEKLGSLRRVHRERDMVMKNLGVSLVEILKCKPDHQRPLVQHIANAVCAHLVHFYGRLDSDNVSRAAFDPLSWRQERDVKAFMLANLSNDMPLATIAAAAGVSSAHFSERFREVVGFTPAQWIRKLRVSKAKQLLNSWKHPEEVVAAMCGYSNVGEFRDMFQAETGAKPLEWRRKFS